MLMLHNNLTRKKEPFTPQNANRVTVYVCGPTVYGPAHIGNARPAVVFDVLVRLLRQLYPQVVYARNITDIDDRITAAAAQEGVGIEVIAARYRAQYHSDMEALDVLPPDIEPHATAHIAAIQTMIGDLLAGGFAYEAEGHVLFDVTRDSEYGHLSGRDRADMWAGARVEPAPYKRDPADFILWKPSSPDLPGWDSPWGLKGGGLNEGGLKGGGTDEGAQDGRGRPGWHIECSAMIKQHLGETIDIHGGGADLQFPHHENESAQSRCAHGAPLARFWLHNGMLTISGEKMSKSLGNITLVCDLLGEYAGEAVRLALLQTHYRQALDFTPNLLAQCTTMLDRLYRGLAAMDDDGATTATSLPPPPDAFMAALCDDLNTPQAMAVLFEQMRTGTKSEILAAGRVLGILQNADAWFARQSDVDADMRARIESLIATRTAARAAKDFARADAARDELEAMGVVLEDTADGTKWRRK